jgi:hypothetical protein
MYVAGDLFMLERTYPKDKGARALEIGGPEEKVVYGLLLRWSEGAAEAEATDPTMKVTRTLVQIFIRVLEKRAGGSEL